MVLSVHMGVRAGSAQQFNCQALGLTCFTDVTYTVGVMLCDCDRQEKATLRL